MLPNTLEMISLAAMPCILSLLRLDDLRVNIRIILSLVMVKDPMRRRYFATPTMRHCLATSSLSSSSLRFSKCLQAMLCASLLAESREAVGQRLLVLVLGVLCQTAQAVSQLPRTLCT